MVVNFTAINLACIADRSLVRNGVKFARHGDLIDSTDRWSRIEAMCRSLV